jgi:hypothetical protein
MISKTLLGLLVTVDGALLGCTHSHASDVASSDNAFTVPTMQVSGDDAQFLAGLLASAGVPVDNSAPGGPSRTAWLDFAWDIGMPYGNSGNFFNPRPARAFVEWGTPYWPIDRASAGRVWQILSEAGAMQYVTPDWADDDAGHAYEYAVEVTEGQVTCASSPVACTIHPKQNSTVWGIDSSQAAFDLLVNAGVAPSGPNRWYTGVLTFFGYVGMGVPPNPQRGELDTLDGTKLADVDQEDLGPIWRRADDVLLVRESASWIQTRKVSVSVSCESSWGSISCTWKRLAQP